MFSQKKFLITVFISTITLIFYYYYSFNKKENLICNKWNAIHYALCINEPTLKQLEDAKYFAKKRNNIYSIFICLDLSFYYIKINNLVNATFYLQEALKKSCEENLQFILKLRLVNLKIHQKEMNEAIAILENIKDKSWQPLVKEKKGDIYSLLKKYQIARSFYEEAIQITTSEKMKEIICIKLNDITE